MDTKKKAKQMMSKLDRDGYLDYALRNGPIVSSKDITALDNGEYSVYHNIDGSYGQFSRLALMEVFEGKRNIWDADIDFESGEDIDDDSGCLHNYQDDICKTCGAVR